MDHNINLLGPDQQLKTWNRREYNGKLSVLQNGHQILMSNVSLNVGHDEKSLF